MSAPWLIAEADAGDGAWSFLYTMPGPEFLGLYFVWFIFLIVGVAVARKQGFDNPFITAAGLLSYEGLGGARLVIGSAHGMHKWDFLLLMMGVGALFFVVRARHLKQGFGGSGGSSGGCGGGGCGGGGCGGGGCGGCGG